MGSERAVNAVALQSLLMSGARTYGDHERVAPLVHRALATAASLDYVLMLASETAGARIPAADAERAMREGFARAVDEAIAMLRAIVEIDARARAFARAGLRAIRSTLEVESLGPNVERAFALIALADDASA